MITVPTKRETPHGLKKQTVVITGGGTGIGLAISQAFYESGARVIMLGRRGDLLRQACRKLGKNASYHTGDISHLETIAGLVGKICADGNSPDILINNAGINSKMPALAVTDDEFNRVLQTNLNGLFALSREIARGMSQRKKGVILNITSMAALYGLPKVAAYSAAKSAVLGLTRALAVEWAPYGIRVNAIAPGFIFSEMSEKALDSDPERKRRVLERTPMGRMGEAKEVAAAALFLCSESASYITGVNLPVDGGNSIGF